MLLHFNRKPDAILEYKPEVYPLILEFLGITISELILTFNLSSDDIFTLLKTKDEVILNNLGLSYPLLASLELVNSNDTIIRRETVFGSAVEEAYFICSDIIIFSAVVLISFILRIIDISCPFLEIWEDLLRSCPLLSEQAPWWILEVESNQQAVFHSEVLCFDVRSRLEQSRRKHLPHRIRIMVLFNIVPIKERELSLLHRSFHHLLESLQNQASLCLSRWQLTNLNDLILSSLTNGLSHCRLFGHVKPVVQTRKLAVLQSLLFQMILSLSVSKFEHSEIAGQFNFVIF